MDNERVVSDESSLALDRKEPSLKRALLYQLSYAPTPSEHNTSIQAAQEVEAHNGLGSDAENHAGNPVVLPENPKQYSSHPDAIRTRLRRVQNREQVLEYKRKWHAKRRGEWLNANGPCRTCGSWENLEVDHINPEEKELPAKALWSMSPQDPRRIAELAKCQVLCHDCHVDKTRPQWMANRRRWKITDAQAAEIRQLRASGLTLIVIARRYGVYTSHVSALYRNGRKAYEPDYQSALSDRV